MPETQLFIAGAGWHVRPVAEAAKRPFHFEVVDFLDDSLHVGDTRMDLPGLEPLVSLSKHWDAANQAILAIGNSAVRENLMHQLGAAEWIFATVVHPLAIVAPSVLLGAGPADMAGAIVGTKLRLGMGSIVNCGTEVDHHAVVEVRRER